MKDGKIIAVKYIPIDDIDNFNSFKEEVKIQILSPVCSPSIVCYYNSFNIKDVGFIETEYIDGESLFSFYKQLKELEGLEKTYNHIIAICKDIGKAFKIIHERSIRHNDVKWNNVMIDRNYQPKLIDFGLAEIMKPHFTHREVSAEDIKALGIMLNDIVTYTIYGEIQDFSIFTEKIVKIVPSNNPKYDLLVKKCLERRIRDRLSDEELINF